jgi:hypothetical protein
MLDFEFFARIDYRDIQRMADKFVSTLPRPTDSTNLEIYKTDIAARWFDMFAQAPNPMASCGHPRELYLVCRDFGYFTLERIVVQSLGLETNEGLSEVIRPFCESSVIDVSCCAPMHFF